MSTAHAPAGPVRLTPVGQTYVAAVAVAAGVSLLLDTPVAWVLLVVLALPLSLVAMWVGFYATLAVGFVLGHATDQLSWPVALVWVAVWTATAWVNARLVEKLLRHGWDALRVGPRQRVEDDDPDVW
ncbi:hypothetical protein SAMN04488570_3711 [Nocardioides scoriae]|uniref:Uncharacterized protein n=1 Tax=Nocardioides scoriae TaxID=642780 RepID=A0A1H1Y4K2_9ACTN|nr:hypothetical protein [Nocardioides scoriae]SDT16344.1 hypothetical protein SAMN04488570_3711 [Nocardioides scoriae]